MTDHTKGNCKDCERIVIAPGLVNENNLIHDPLQDMEKYLHNILEDNDPDTVDCKDRYNDALMKNTQLQVIHETMELNAYAYDKFLHAEIYHFQIN